MPFTYPTTVEMRSIQQTYIARSRAGRLGMKIMPVLNVNAAKVRWTQKDIFTGLQHLRGMDGEPTRVNRVGLNTFEYEPGVFGEFTTVTETELTNRAANLDINSVPIDISDLVMECDDIMVVREDDRIESSIFTLLITGTLQILLDGPDGIQTGYSDTYTPKTFTASPAWTSLSSATPIADFQSVVQKGEPSGQSVDFGAAATAYMNTYTANTILNNTNASDFGGRRAQYGATLNSLKDTADYFRGQNLPGIETYDAGNYDKPLAKGGVFTKFIPNGKVLVIGVRPGNAAVGNYQLTRNSSAPGRLPGSYRYVIDRANGVLGEKRTPANIEVHRGHNGGPAIYYPGAVCVMTVF